VNWNWLRTAAHIESDAFEHTDLVDHRCESNGISLDYSAPFNGQEQLEKAIHSPLPGTIDKDITGIFRKASLASQRKEPGKLILILAGVQNLKVIRK
jgi:hypothetical protein